MKIHQVTHLFAPDVLAGASLYTDIASFFHERGHDIRVTTTFSYYPALQFRPEDRGILSRTESYNDIPIKRVGQILPKSHKSWRRLIPEITYLGALTLRGRHRGWVPDVIISACPMLAQVTWLKWAYLGRRVPRLVIVQDSMSHAATELGIIKSKALGSMLHGFERWSLRGADTVSTISDGMLTRVRGIVGEESPSIVIPNWVHRSLAELVASRAKLVQQRASNRLFYSGNFGVKQGLPSFLDIFETERSDWRIDLHGGGAELHALSDRIGSLGDGVCLGGVLAEQEYVDKLLGATACLVTQMPGVGANFLPSKLLPALAAGTPVLAYCEADSPLGREVNEGGFGAVISPGDHSGLCRILEQWRARPELLTEFSSRAKRRAEKYSRNVICGRYEAILEGLVESARAK